MNNQHLFNNNNVINHVLLCVIVCIEGDTRLVDRETSYNPQVVSGTVQVCINQRYGYVCSDEWDDREADVVCRSISSSYRAPYYGNKHALLLNYYILACSYSECLKLMKI